VTSITHILAWGSGQWQTVMLACGHKRHIRKADLKREQLYVGRMVPCADCRLERNHEQHNQKA
jgi:hypothetical protein